MKRFVFGTLIVVFANLSHAQVAPAPTEQEFKDFMDSVQLLMDQSNIECKLKMQPVRNVVRLATSQSLKLKGSCEDKEGTKISGTIKLLAKEKTTVIKKLQITLENLELPRNDF